jgi:RNA ligase
MKYLFPFIEHISDVLPALEGEGGEAFGVMERGPFRIINYHYQDPTTFSGPHEALRRECRGLVFDLETGLIINRRFHKFFNINEKPDTQHDVLDWSDQLHVVMQKVDGSMISPVFVGRDYDHVRWISKMGITDTAMRAEEFVATRPQYRDIASECLGRGYTPIFEWCSRRDRIVIDHPQDDLVLLAIRCNHTGAYLGRNAIEEMGGSHKVTTVKTFDGFSGAALDYARDIKDTEGFVIQFGNHHMVKLKTDWYVSIHKAKELLGSPRRVVENAINGTIDDLLAILPSDDQARVEEDVKTFWSFFNYAVTMKENLLRDIKAEMDRKTFALGPAQQMLHPGVLFTAWDGKVSMSEAVLTIIKKNLGTDRRFDETIKSLIGDIKWTTGSRSELQDA